MLFNLGTLGVFDTTRPRDFVRDFTSLIIEYSTAPSESSELSESGHTAPSENTEPAESPLALSALARFGMEERPEWSFRRDGGRGKGASPLDIAILVSQLQKAFTDIRKQTTPDVIHYLDSAFDDHTLRTSHAIYNGMEIGISHKVDPSYPNIRDYDRRPDDLPDDISWQSLASMQSAQAYYQKIADAYSDLVKARIETIIAHHPGQKCVEAVQEAFTVTVPKDNTTLPQLI